MSITINKDICVSCGNCSNICPGNLIKLDHNKKAYIEYPEECWGCTSCLKECKAYAIRFFLGADIGGTGCMLHTKVNGSLLNWIMERTDGTTEVIIIDTTQSNEY